MSDYAFHYFHYQKSRILPNNKKKRKLLFFQFYSDFYPLRAYFIILPFIAPSFCWFLCDHVHINLEHCIIPQKYQKSLNSSGSSAIGKKKY